MNVTRYHGKLAMSSEYTYQVPTYITVGHTKSVGREICARGCVIAFVLRC